MQFRPGPNGIEAADLQIAAICFEKSCDQPQQGRLARPVGADKSCHATGLYRGADRIQRWRKPRHKALGYGFSAHQRRHGQTPSSGVRTTVTGMPSRGP